MMQAHDEEISLISQEKLINVKNQHSLETTSKQTSFSLLRVTMTILFISSIFLMSLLLSNYIYSQENVEFFDQTTVKAPTPFPTEHGRRLKHHITHWPTKNPSSTQWPTKSLDFTPFPTRSPDYTPSPSHIMWPTYSPETRLIDTIERVPVIWVKSKRKKPQ